MQPIRGAVLQLSPSVCNLLVSLRESLQYYQKYLESSIFLKFWQRLARETNEFLYKEVSYYKISCSLTLQIST